MALTAPCPIHQGQIMYEKEYNGNTFWSHRTDDPDYAPKGYCNGKPPKGTNGYGSNGYQAAKETRDRIAAPHSEPVAQVTDWAEKDRRISRMSCQKQAIETMRLIMDFNMKDSEFQYTKQDLLGEIKELTDYFELDLNNS